MKLTVKQLKVLIKEAVLNEYERYMSGGKQYSEEHPSDVLYYFDPKDKKLKHMNSRKPVSPMDYDLADPYNTSGWYEWHDHMIG